MKNLTKILLAATFSLAATAPVMAEVAVSVTVGQPGFYGRIDIGGYPAPRVVYAQPRVIYREAIHREPIYLRVPPGHAKNWRKHCQRYNACQERVYFVQDTWYQQEYAPRYQAQHGGGHADEWHDNHHQQQSHDDNHHGNDHGNHRGNGQKNGDHHRGGRGH